MKRATVGERCFRRRWMIPTGRARSGMPRGTAARLPISVSFCTVGRGRMLTPASMAMACLIVSMLSNSITTFTRTFRCFRARSMALRIPRSGSKATNFSPFRSWGITARRRANRCAGWQTRTIFSDRHGITASERMAGG